MTSRDGTMFTLPPFEAVLAAREGRARLRRKFASSHKVPATASRFPRTRLRSTPSA